MDESPNFDPAANNSHSLHRLTSQAIVDQADEFVMQQSKRERPTLVNIAID